MENKEKKTKHTRLKYVDRIEIQRLIEEGCTKTEIAEKNWCTFFHNLP